MSLFDASGCPFPRDDETGRVVLAHGEGGRATRRLLEEHIFPRLNPAGRPAWEDAAVLPALAGAPVLSTDSFVVSPLFFPGGDIGSLAVYGTVNDLLMRGARPLWLSLSMILEEGLPLSTLDAVVDRIAFAVRRCNVKIIAGDTKVVPRGAADGMFLTTTGLGELRTPSPPGPSTLQIGDAILVSGPIGRHGIAVLSAREQLRFDPPPRSDCGHLSEAIEALYAAGIQPRALRDATRGGVAAVLHEWAQDSGRTLLVDESQVPVGAEVRGVAELLGLDPLSIANEGTFLAAVAPKQAEQALVALRSVELHRRAAIIGVVRETGVTPVVVRRFSGQEQPLLEPNGAPLPRIC